MKQLLYILRERLKLFGPKSQQLSNERQIIDDKMKQMGFENLDDDEIYHLKKKLSMKKLNKIILVNPLMFLLEDMVIQK